MLVHKHPMVEVKIYGIPFMISIPKLQKFLDSCRNIKNDTIYFAIGSRGGIIAFEENPKVDGNFWQSPENYWTLDLPDFDIEFEDPNEWRLTVTPFHLANLWDITKRKRILFTSGKYQDQTGYVDHVCTDGQYPTATVVLDGTGARVFADLSSFITEPV
ncbi:hypothetical protein [Vibrio phage BX-1]|nr:hypothetical protein [Vibrio phage BX-1]